MKLADTISVIVPSYNEEENIEATVNGILDACANLKCDVIVVDDGSTDNTASIVEKLSLKNKKVKLVKHRRNLGKTAAIDTGLLHASGDIIVLIDADLQYNFAEIPKLVEPIISGKADVVNGWRVKRADSLSRRFSSKTYNWLVRRLFHVDIKDSNSGLKAFKRSALKSITREFRTDFHRFIIPLAAHSGFRIIEVPLTHRRRAHGKSKYASPMRLMSGSTDFIALKLTLVFRERPMALFGSVGIISLILGFIAWIYLLVSKLLYADPILPRFPLAILASLALLAGLFLILIGFLAEMITSIWKEIHPNE